MEYGENMTKEELDQQGLNYSLTHVDFMIGSSEMNMDGETTDKKKELLIRSGELAF
jgi:aminopeptidase